MKLKHCNNFHDFRKLAKKNLPSPIFHYIDGAAEDETTYRRNTSSYVPIEELSKINTPKMFQFYYHKDHGINDAVLDRVKESSFDVLALTVDTITSGNRERDLKTGFTSPPKLTLGSLYSFISKPKWG